VRNRVIATAIAGLVLFMVVAVAGWALGRWLTATLGADVASFDAGMIATVCGIVVGIPAAVGISLGLRRLEQDAATRADRQKYTALLRTIDQDLGDVLDDLLEEGPNGRGRRDIPVAPFLGSGLWEALRSSGQVERIRDPFLLRVIARAYDRIGVTGYLERLAWELDMNPMSRALTGTPTILEEAMVRVASQDGYTRMAIDHAREQIAAEIGVLPTAQP
jgi:hypothetical protein